MKNSYFFVFFFIFIITLASFVIIGINNKQNSDKVIENLYDAIELAEQKGDYNCCIEPACTMCYLGHWKFDKGTCKCDQAIAEGRDDDVCPECKAGLEMGLCDSAIKEDCILDEEIYG